MNPNFDGLDRPRSEIDAESDCDTPALGYLLKSVCTMLTDLVRADPPVWPQGCRSVRCSVARLHQLHRRCPPLPAASTKLTSPGAIGCSGLPFSTDPFTFASLLLLVASPTPPSTLAILLGRMPFSHPSVLPYKPRRTGSVHCGPFICWQPSHSRVQHA